MQGLKWHNWPTRYLACELCYPTTLADSTSKHTLPLQALCAHFFFFFLHAYFSYTSRSMLYIDSVAGMKLSLNFFSNPNVKTQLTENSVLGLKEKKLQLCIFFYFIFFCLSCQKDLQRPTWERNCKVSHLIIDRNCFC